MREFDTTNFHGHPRFYEILQEMADLHSRKNHDYSGDDPLSNLRASEEIGIPAWKSVIVRLMDKWSRIKNFVREGNFEVKDESVKDTLMDNAVYSILCIIMLDEEKSETPKAAGLRYDYDPEYCGPRASGGTCASSTAPRIPNQDAPLQYGGGQ